MTETEFLEEVKSNQGIIYKLVGLYANDTEEKKDLYQEILLNAWKSIKNFRGEAKFSTWLYRVSLNTIITHKRKRTVVDYKESTEELAPAVQHSSLQNERAAALQKAIRQLAETDRALVSLHLDGYDNGEIADMLGITPNNVAVKLLRCRQKLTTLLTSSL